MQLHSRPVTWKDLCENQASLWGCYGQDSALWPCLPDVWRRLLTGDALIGAVVEDLTRPPERRIVAQGASVFVTDAFAEAAKTTLPPFLSAQLAATVLRGDSPVLGLEAVRRANEAEGLNLFILHKEVGRHTLPLEQYYQAEEALASVYFAMHRGYNLKEFLQECRGPEECRWYVNSGLKLRTDYADFYERRTPPPPESRPFLLGLTRPEAEQSPGYRGFQMFVHTPARLHFTLAEQDLLHRALGGETDEELAASLCLSVSTVKKRWLAIYDRVLDTDAGLLTDGPDDLLPRADGRRGAERRRHLLNYLRSHPENLNPVYASR